MDMGLTTQNWLGRSQYIADAFFSGMIDDFRIYETALSAAEVKYLSKNWKWSLCERKEKIRSDDFWILVVKLSQMNT